MCQLPSNNSKSLGEFCNVSFPQVTTSEVKYNYVLRLAERWRTFKLMFVSNEDLFNLCLNLELFACLATGNLILDLTFTQ